MRRGFAPDHREQLFYVEVTLKSSAEKTDLRRFLPLGIALAVCVVSGIAAAGFLSADKAISVARFLYTLALLVVAVALSLYLQRLIALVGMLFSGRAHGFSFCRLHCGNVFIQKEKNGRLRLKPTRRRSFFCKMDPPDHVKKKDLQSFLFANAKANLLSGAICLLTALLIPKHGTVGFFTTLLLLTGISGICMGIVSLIPDPRRGNGAYIRRQLKCDRAACEVAEKRMRIENALFRGARLSELPAEPRELPSSRLFAAEAGCFSCLRQIAAGETDASEKALSAALAAAGESRTPQTAQLRLFQVYFLLLQGNAAEARAVFESPAVTGACRRAANDPLCLAVRFSFALLADNNGGRAKELYALLEKTCKDDGFTVEERSLAKTLCERAVDAHAARRRDAL